MNTPIQLVSKTTVGKSSKFGLTRIKIIVNISVATFGYDWSFENSKSIVDYFTEDMALYDRVGIHLQYLTEEVFIPFKKVPQITPELFHDYLNRLFENLTVCGTLAITVTTVKLPPEYTLAVK